MTLNNSDFRHRRFASKHHFRQKPRKPNHRLIFKLFAYFLISIYVYKLWNSGGEKVVKTKQQVSKLGDPGKISIKTKPQKKRFNEKPAKTELEEDIMEQEKKKINMYAHKVVNPELLHHSGQEEKVKINKVKPDNASLYDQTGSDGKTEADEDDRLPDGKKKVADDDDAGNQMDATRDNGKDKIDTPTDREGHKTSENAPVDDDDTIGINGSKNDDVDKKNTTKNNDNFYENETSNATVTGSVYRRLGNEEESELYGKIKSISILGERNTGTTWLYDHLFNCFEESDVNVLRRMTRYKHWFQLEDDEIMAKKGTLVISMYRNIYEWSRAMIATPHHAPAHMDLDWKEFLTKSWTMERVGKDLNVTEEQKKNPHFCQEKFQYKDVVSCHVRPYPAGTFKKTRFSEHQPFYEMRNDGSGTPYDNILEMRTDKIKHFSSLVNYTNVEDLWVVQYEDLLSHGTKEVLEKLKQLTGVSPKCEWSPPQLNRKKRAILPEMMEFLNKNVDWEVEKSIGYEQIEVPKANALTE